MVTKTFNKKKILIIHHDEFQGSTLKQHLSNYPYDIITMRNGNEGFEYTQEQQPDAVIASAHLKDIDGIDLCWMIRQTSEIANTPYFLIVEYMNQEEKINAFRTGVDAIFDNNTSVRELYTRIEAIMKRFPRSYQPASAEPLSSIIGKIPHFTIVEILQLLNISQKSGTISFTCESQHGEIGYWEGKIVWAKQANLIGEEAVYAIAKWQKGHFSFEQDLIHPVVNVHTPTMQLILDCCKTLDEQGAGV